MERDQARPSPAASRSRLQLFVPVADFTATHMKFAAASGGVRHRWVPPSPPPPSLLPLLRQPPVRRCPTAPVAGTR